MEMAKNLLNLLIPDITSQKNQKLSNELYFSKIIIIQPLIINIHHQARLANKSKNLNFHSAVADSQSMI